MFLYFYQFFITNYTKNEQKPSKMTKFLWNKIPPLKLRLMLAYLIPHTFTPYPYSYLTWEIVPVVVIVLDFLTLCCSKRRNTQYPALFTKQSHIHTHLPLRRRRVRVVCSGANLLCDTSDVRAQGWIVSNSAESALMLVAYVRMWSGMWVACTDDATMDRGDAWERVEYCCISDWNCWI